MHMMIQKKEHQLQPKLSTILKHEISYIPQAFGTFSDGTGKYCALGALAKYFGYDVQTHNPKNDAFASSDLIPLVIINRIEGFVSHRRIEEYPHCTCKTKNYFHYSLIPLLIHLNDYHQMTFQEMGNWLESKDM